MKEIMTTDVAFHGAVKVYFVIFLEITEDFYDFIIKKSLPFANLQYDE